MDTDVDRLESIKALGGQLVRYDGGEFWAIFDNPSQDSSFGEHDVEGTAPMLTARTIDVDGLSKDAVLHVGSDEFRLIKHEPDGTGISRLILGL